MGTRIFCRTRIDAGLATTLTWILPVLGGAGCSGQVGDGSTEAAAERAALECEGACPVYVDPGAAADGDGSSWVSPLRSVQAAIDAQAARGGSEVWVRAGGPFASLSGDPEATLIQLREGVAVFGGFSGSEASAEDRDPASRTVIQGSDWGEDGDAAPLVLGASGAAVDGFSILGHHGPVLVLREVTEFRAANLTIEDAYADDAGFVDVSNSEATFVGLVVRASTSVKGVAGLVAAGSAVRLEGSEFRGSTTKLGAAGALAASASTLVLDRVRFVENRADTAGQSAAIHVTDSDVLAIDSVWLRNTAERGLIRANGSRFVAVSSHWEANVVSAGSVSLRQGSAGTFLNSSFVANRALAFGTVYGLDSQLTIVSSTFADNRADSADGDEPHDVGFEGEGQPTFSSSYSNRGAQSILPPYSGAGNCLRDDLQPHLRTVDGLTRALLPAELGCTDGGDDSAARSATESARDFAGSLGAAIPLGPEWWRSSSSVSGVVTDVGAIDPGRHYPADAE